MALYVPPSGIGQVLHLAAALLSKIMGLFR